MMYGMGFYMHANINLACLHFRYFQTSELKIKGNLNWRKLHYNSHHEEGIMYDMDKMHGSEDHKHNKIRSIYQVKSCCCLLFLIVGVCGWLRKAGRVVLGPAPGLEVKFVGLADWSRKAVSVHENRFGVNPVGGEEADSGFDPRWRHCISPSFACKLPMLPKQWSTEQTIM